VISKKVFVFWYGKGDPYPPPFSYPYGLVVRRRPGFDSLAESDQKTIKVGIHRPDSFPA